MKGLARRAIHRTGAIRSNGENLTDCRHPVKRTWDRCTGGIKILIYKNMCLNEESKAAAGERRAASRRIWIRWGHWQRI